MRRPALSRWQMRMNETLKRLTAPRRVELLEGGGWLRVTQIVRLAVCGWPALHTFGQYRPRPGTQSMVLRQAVGVAGLIVPWNSPAYLLIRFGAGACGRFFRCRQAARTGAQTAQLGSILASVPGAARCSQSVCRKRSDGAKFLSNRPMVISFTLLDRRAIAIAGAAVQAVSASSLEQDPSGLDDADIKAAILPYWVDCFCRPVLLTGSRLLVQRNCGQIQDLLSQSWRRYSQVHRRSASQMGPLIDRQASSRSS